MKHRSITKGDPAKRIVAWLALALWLGFSSTIAGSARAAQGLGELEEPGQVERRPAEEVSAKAAEEETQPNEATAILPDSEAVDPTIEEDAAPTEGTAGAGSTAASETHPSGDAATDTSAGVQLEDPDKDAEHPDEATTILPDSEAVDETIVEEKEPAVEEQKATAPAPSDDPAPARDPQWSIRWQNAFIVERVDDPRYQFLFGGKVQNDWGLYAPDDDLEDSIGGDGTGVKFRRARLYFQGQFFRYGFFKVEYDFSGGSENDFADVYAGLSGLPKIGLLRIGHFKEPFSLQWQNSSSFISFSERAAIDVFSPGRNTGIMVNGNFIVRDSTFAVSVTRRTDGVGEGFSSKEDYHLTARLTGLPIFEEGGARLLHLELGYSHQFADKDEGTRYDQQAANDFSPVLADTGDLPADDVDLFNAGFALVEGPLSFQSEVTLSIPRGDFSEDPIFWGSYAQLSYWLTGENRRYLRGRGVFSRVVPKNRFDPEKGQWGGVEIATRYSWLDLSNDGIRGGTLGEWSVAINWLLFSNMRMSNNYVLTSARDRMGTESGLAHSWVTRFQVDF